MLRLHLGPVARWPWLLQVLLPLVVITGLWMALHPLLTHFGIISRVRSKAHLVEQGLLIGVALYFTLQFLLPVFLLLHLVTSYVYLGSNPVWDFVGATARNLLAPLRWLPLRIARFDFAPLAGVLLILLLLHWLPNLILGRMAENNAEPLAAIALARPANLNWPPLSAASTATVVRCHARFESTACRRAVRSGAWQSPGPNPAPVVPGSCGRTAYRRRLW